VATTSPGRFFTGTIPPGENDPYLIENLRYLGRSNVVEINGLTVAGLSGVYGSSSYGEPSDQRLRWAKDNDWRRNKKLGHFRKDEVNNLIDECEDRQIDILMTHSWPVPTDFEEIPEELLLYGVKPVSELVEFIQPKIHLCGHVHRPHQATMGGTDIYCPGKVSSEFEGDYLVLSYDGNTFKPDSKWKTERVK
jgi:Icc-related predicted phosphoesterase